MKLHYRAGHRATMLSQKRGQFILHYPCIKNKKVLLLKKSQAVYPSEK